MKKKILGIAVAIVMLFAVAGLAACELDNPTLAEYQATARVDLTNYANSRGQTNFTIENWAVIQGHVTTGKAAIDAAETKPAVRTARDNAKAAVRAVERENNVNNYTRHPNSVDTINAELENQLRRGIIGSDFIQESWTFDDVWVDGFFGIYNDSVAVIMAGGFPFPGLITPLVVAGKYFYFSSSPGILIWHDGYFIPLLRAYTDGVITRQSVEKIYYLWSQR
ncbi:MAG: hypothetical protein FWE22_04800 [Firmicutes bacterium]|nr:hypothetical protein [Bacillota bacterium]